MGPLLSAAVFLILTILNTLGLVVMFQQITPAIENSITGVYDTNKGFSGKDVAVGAVIGSLIPSITGFEIVTIVKMFKYIKVRSSQITPATESDEGVEGEDDEGSED